MTDFKQILDEYEILPKKIKGKDRYVVLHKGKIVDNAHGYGYKTFLNALKSTFYKTHNEEYIKFKEECEKLYNELKEFLKPSEWILSDVSDLEDGVRRTRKGMLNEFWDDVTARHPETTQYRFNKALNKYILD